MGDERPYSVMSPLPSPWEFGEADLARGVLIKELKDQAPDLRLWSQYIGEEETGRSHGDVGGLLRRSRPANKRRRPRSCAAR